MWDNIFLAQLNDCNLALCWRIRQSKKKKNNNQTYKYTVEEWYQDLQRNAKTFIYFVKQENWAQFFSHYTVLLSSVTDYVEFFFLFFFLLEIIAALDSSLLNHSFIHLCSSELFPQAIFQSFGGAVLYLLHKI